MNKRARRLALLLVWAMASSMWGCSEESAPAGESNSVQPSGSSASEGDLAPTDEDETAREIIEGLVDIWAYYGYHGTRRRLWVRGSDHINAGHRLKDHFKLNGNDLEWIDMGDSEESAAKNFVDAFNNRYVPPPTPEPETVTKRIKKLEKRS